MAKFMTMIHVTGSARKLEDDLEFLQTIMQSVYANHATVFRDWVGVATSRQKQNIPDEEVDWETILNENIDAIKKSDLVIVEASQARFSQGFQVYVAAQHKKPTLVVTRSEIKERFISGVGNKFITLKQYSTIAELQELVAKFIKQNTIPEKDLRFNMILDRRIYKFLRDTAHETGKNKSQIVRELLENEAEKRK
ncbi:MAG TPA: hypothetical protein VIQ80_02480 [Candidatus Saccharimonadales bacterium]